MSWAKILKRIIIAALLGLAGFLGVCLICLLIYSIRTHDWDWPKNILSMIDKRLEDQGLAVNPPTSQENNTRENQKQSDPTPNPSKLDDDLERARKAVKLIKSLGD